MITKLQINNFKCFQKSPVFEFTKFNLLTGINGRGKSSLLQSILLLSQTTWEKNRFDSLIINGNLIELGNFDDIKNSDTPRGSDITFNLETDKSIIQSASIAFKENELNPLLADLSELNIKSNNNTYIFKPQDISHYSNTPIPNEDIIDALWSPLLSVHYISADRLGPVKYVEKLNPTTFLNVGPKGEHTINILANDNLPLVNNSLYRGEDARTVIQQTEEWLKYILDGASIEIKGKEKESSVLYMLLNNKSNSSSRYKPINIGFGYSYALPLIVAGLIAKPGEIIIVENPEAHLHPRAQSKIAEFFAIVASCGVQVFIESHSEHILNGIRVSALNPDINLSNNDASVQYFNENFGSEKLIIDSKGKIANWPYGFFDQQEIDLANIFKHSKKQ